MIISKFWTALRNWFSRQRILPSPERAGLISFIGAVAFLVFMYGFFSAYARIFPFKVIEQAMLAAVLVTKTQEEWGMKFQDFIYYDTQHRKKYSNKFDSEESCKSLNLINYFNNDQIHIISNNGDIIYSYKPKWHADDIAYFYEKFRKKTRFIDSPQFIYVQDFHIYPDGGVLMMMNVAGRIWPFGIGFIRIDADSNIIWKSIVFDTHHNFDVSSDGRIFALTSNKLEQSSKGYEQLPSPFIDNQIIILDKFGRKIDNISLIESIKNSDYSYYINSGNILPVSPNNSSNDYLHANDVNFINAAQAKVFPYGEEGDLLVSMRDIHAIGVLDLHEKRFQWMKRGPWIAQHDPDILPNGNLLIFDNMGGRKESGWSRIIEFNPETEQVVWEYTGTNQDPFETVVRGSQQPLLNGNVLISETMGGRVFEVNRKGQIVWQFVTPFKLGDRKQYVPAIRWPKRVSVDYFSAEFRTRLEKAINKIKPLNRHYLECKPQKNVLE